MPASRFLRMIAFVVTVLLASGAFADDKTSFTSEVMDVIDAVMSEHIEPPTRQQMILKGTREIYIAEEKKPPGDLAEVVSGLSSRDETVEFLHTLQRDTTLTPELCRNRFLHSLDETVPGGATIMPAKAAHVEEQIAANRYVGIGIALGMNDGIPSVQQLIYGGPGWRSGVKKGDLILKIDGKPTDGSDINQIIDELRGEEGSNVVLALKQPDEDERIIEVTRGVTFIPTIVGQEEKSPGDWDYRIPSEPEMALLKISRIGPSTVHELKTIEAKLRTTDLKGLVLDLRGSHGGTLHDTVLLADQLLEEGTIGYAVNRDKEKKYEARPGSLFNGIPIAVLVDGNEGPAQVFLACALQDHLRAAIVGVPNRLPVFVKSHVTMPDGKKLTLATGRLKRSNGTLLTSYQMVGLRQFDVRKKPRFRERGVARLGQEFDGSSFPYIQPNMHVRGAGNGTDQHIAAALHALKKAINKNKPQSNRVSSSRGQP